MSVAGHSAADLDRAAAAIEASQITVLCSDVRHHVVPMLMRWCKRRGAHLVFAKDECAGGKLLFLVSCTEIVGAAVRRRYAKTLVIHESDVPRGRGWSPLAWQILEGKKDFTVSLIEAEDRVDSGAVWATRPLHLEGHELAEEINEARDLVRERLMDFAVENFDRISPVPQTGEPTYYARRTPKDSHIDPHRSLAEQFDQIRICDERFPAFFDLRGHRYELTVRKAGVSP